MTQGMVQSNQWKTEYLQSIRKTEEYGMSGHYSLADRYDQHTVTESIETDGTLRCR